jgi:hypothetical protein
LIGAPIAISEVGLFAVPLAGFVSPAAKARDRFGVPVAIIAIPAGGNHMIREYDFIGTVVVALELVETAL